MNDTGSVLKLPHYNLLAKELELKKVPVRHNIR